jgi:outer membrane lipoprotein carrier protein
MLRKVFIFLLFVLPHALMADMLEFSCNSGSSYTPAQSTELLAQVQKSYSKTRSLKAQFTQESYLAALDLSEMSTGEVWFEKPGKMKWNYRQPDEQTFLVDRETLWFYQKSEGQLLIDQLEKVLLTDLPVSFLLGLGDVTKDFNVQSACKTGEGVLLVLARKSRGEERDELAGFDLLVSEKSHQPIGARVKDVAGNITSFIFSNTEYDKVLENKLFAASFPKGIDIIDRRKNKSG